MGYDRLQRMTSQTDPNGLTLTFTYDARGFRTVVQDSKSGVTTTMVSFVRRAIELKAVIGSLRCSRTEPTIDTSNSPSSLGRSYTFP